MNALSQSSLIAIIGAGAMGAGIAQVAAQAGQGVGGGEVFHLQLVEARAAGEVLGVSEGTVAWRMSEVKKRLRAMAAEDAR